MDNLWGDFSEIGTIRTPQKILNEQASYLNSNTKSKVLASLLRADRPIDILEFERSSDFKFDFILTSPNIKSYKYRIFRLFHDVQIYPLYLKLDRSISEELDESLLDLTKGQEIYPQSYPDNNAEYEILNEEIFVEFLRVVLTSNTMKRVIASLVSLGDTM